MTPFIAGKNPRADESADLTVIVSRLWKSIDALGERLTSVQPIPMMESEK